MNFKIWSLVLVVVGVVTTIWSLNKTYEEESNKLEVALDADYNLLRMMVDGVVDCLQEYNGSEQIFGNLDYTKINKLTLKAAQYCNTQVHSSIIKGAETYYELRLVPVRFSGPYEAAKYLFSEDDAVDCVSSLQRVTYVCPEYISSHVTDKVNIQ